MLWLGIEEVERGSSFLLEGVVGNFGMKNYNGGGISILGLRGCKISMGDLGIEGGWDTERHDGFVTPKAAPLCLWGNIFVSLKNIFVFQSIRIRFHLVFTENMDSKKKYWKNFLGFPYYSSSIATCLDVVLV